MLDPNDPTAGVLLKMVGGDEVGGGSKKYFEVRLNCISIGRDVLIPEGTGIVVTDLLSHLISLDTISACPSECVSSNKMCNNHGVCGYDNENGFTHCFCNDGYQGDYCQNSIINIYY